MVPTLAALLALSLPGCDYVCGMCYRAKRTEILGNVDGIRREELTYRQHFDEYVAVREPWPRAVSELTKAQHPWREGSGFDTLGWSPDGQVRGAYWVELSPDGTDFTVHGVIDIDGDGEVAHARATRESSARLDDEDAW